MIDTTMACRSCQKRIGFIKTTAGRNMPVDPELVRVRLMPARRTTVGKPRLLVLPGGVVRRGVETSDGLGEPIEGYVPHWATCPTAAQHRSRP